MNVNVFQVLKELIDAPGVTGFEEQRREKIIEHFSGYCDTVWKSVV